jgi:uroporphyrinogen decarboxylase
VDFWATETVIQRLERELAISYPQFLDHYDVDLRYIAGPTYIGPALEDNTDIWGVKRSVLTVGCNDGSEVYSEVMEPPLSKADTLEDIEKYRNWPDADWFDYTVVESQCDAILREKRIVVFMGDRLNRVAQLKPSMYLRGTEEMFLDIALRQEMTQAIFKKIKDFYLAYLKRILDAAKGKIDIVLTGDDFGGQNGLLISPQAWRTLIKPGFAEYISLIKSYNAIAMHHTCGSVLGIIPDMIECGLDVLQSIQPEAKNMALADLKTKFGERICFHGGISIQRTMPYGSPDEIRREVKRIADIVKAEGGYIFCTSHNIQADTPLESVQALMTAYLDYGRMTG